MMSHQTPALADSYVYEYESFTHRDNAAEDRHPQASYDIIHDLIHLKKELCQIHLLFHHLKILVIFAN